KRGGMMGNIYSMGLALQVQGGRRGRSGPAPRHRSRRFPPPPQALGSTAMFYAPREWDCAQAFSVVYGHDYRQPMAIAQVLPALVGKSYLEAASLECAASSEVSPSLQSLKPCPVEVQKARIRVRYSIINTLRGKHFNESISVGVPAGSTLLQVLQAAEKKEPDIFSFRTEQTSWGPMVVSIHGLAADPEDRTYWQFLSGKDALQEGGRHGAGGAGRQGVKDPPSHPRPSIAGVGTYVPVDGERIRAVFSTY
ncbi:IF factor, partial [Uria aalge]|nr:IF factor [Uria aalge]